MKTLKISGIKTMAEAKTFVTGGHWHVNSHNLMGAIIKPVQDMPPQYHDVYLEYNGEKITYKNHPHKFIEIAHFNHIGEVLQAKYIQEVIWKWLFLKRIPTINIIDTIETNTLIYEETYYPKKKILAANLLSNISEYKKGLDHGNYNCFIYAEPKYGKKETGEDILFKARDEVGLYPYADGKLIAFYWYCRYGVWIGSNNKNNYACGQFLARHDREIFNSRAPKEIPVEDYKIYSRLIPMLKNENIISPVFWLNLPEFYDYYLIIE